MANNDAIKLCVFCKEKASYKGNPILHFMKFSCEICGDFIIQDILFDELNNKQLDYHIVNCVSENIRTNEKGSVPLWIKSENDLVEVSNREIGVIKLYELISNQKKLAGKANEVLESLALFLTDKNPFAPVILSRKGMYRARILTFNELFWWYKDLTERNLIKIYEFDERIENKNFLTSNLASFNVFITPEGWRIVEPSRTTSKEVFIAMSFGYVKRAELQSAIEKACTKTGWKGISIDKEEYLGSIMDEVVAKIKKSAFVIAEFTEHKHGVYYEAGYAEGVGIPVIFVVKKDEMKIAHFDTKHLNHITWETLEELEKKLVNRINAIINKRQVIT